MVNWSPNFDQLPISQELNESKSAEKLNTSIILPKLFLNNYTFCKLELTETQSCSLWLKFGIDSSLAMFCREAAVHARANPKLTLPKKDRQLAIIRPQLTALASTSFISDWLSFYTDVQIVDSLACLCWKSVSPSFLVKKSWSARNSWDHWKLKVDFFPIVIHFSTIIIPKRNKAIEKHVA